MKSSHILLFLALVLLVAGSRTLPHPPNFTPLMAIAVFSGAFLGSRTMAYLFPLSAMVISDLFIGFHSFSAVVYISMIPAVFLGAKIGRGTFPFGERRSWKGLKWFGLGLSADLSFFILTNLAIWWLSGFYEHSLAGLTECFVLALPFLINQILGTGTFLGLLLFTWYGLMVLAQWREPNLKYQRYR